VTLHHQVTVSWEFWEDKGEFEEVRGGRAVLIGKLGDGGETSGIWVEFGGMPAQRWLA